MILHFFVQFIQVNRFIDPPPNCTGVVVDFQLIDEVGVNLLAQLFPMMNIGLVEDCILVDFSFHFSILILMISIPIMKIIMNQNDK